VTRIRTVLAGTSKLDNVAYGIARAIISAFTHIWCRMRVEGRENVPKTGAFLLAPVHRSILDTPIASGVTRRRMRFMGADKYWKNRAFGRLLTALGGFPVTRGTADREALRRCIALLENGEPLVLFPEGERKSGDLVQPLFDGAAYVAVKAGVPIIPIGIGGSERAMPKGARFIYPRKVHVIVGAPIVAPPSANAKEQRQIARDTTARLHEELQRLFDLASSRV